MGFYKVHVKGRKGEGIVKRKQAAAILLSASLTVGSISGAGVLPAWAAPAGGQAAAEQTVSEAETTAAENGEINLALGRPARASHYQEANGDIPAREPGLALDGRGDNSEANINSRWQSSDVMEFQEEWLETDLGNSAKISKVTVRFFAKLYGSFVIETADSQAEDADWREIGRLDIPSGTEMNIVREVDVRQNGQPVEVSRYVRLRFTSGNDNAASRGIGVYELEIYGTLAEPDQPEEGETVTGNIAQGKKAVASGVESGMENCRPELAVDGNYEDDNSRWSAPQMKTGNAQDQQQQMQWLELDLRDKVTDITDIRIHFFKKVFSTDYVIKTRVSESDEWRTVAEKTAASSADIQNPVDTIDTVKELDRYVRFEFRKVNPLAGGNSVSVREIEINGTQAVLPYVPESAQEVMDAVKGIGEITEDMTAVPLPEVAEGYEIRVIGSEFPQVISDDGQIGGWNIYDYDSMEIMLQVTNKEDAGDTAKKTFLVNVPKKTQQHPELFPAVEVQNEEPQVIPSIQEWYGYSGEVTLGKDSRIIVKDNAGLDLQRAAVRLQEDLTEIMGVKPEIVTGQEADGDDIILESVTEDRYMLGEEGYLLQADDSGIHITGAGYNGCFYGAMTLEQVLYSRQGDFTFPKGVARDFSKYAVRGVMIDIARTPYRMEALEDLVRALSFYKINEVQFHLNDNRHVGGGGDRGNYEHWTGVEGMFRLESDTFPSLKTTPKDNDYYNDEFGGSPQYTKEEYKALQRRAMDYGINPISEIDAPGHSLLFTRYVREHLAEAQAGAPGIKGDIYADKDWELLAMTGEKKESAFAFMNALFDEYLNEEVFLGDTVNIGADEYWNITQAERPGVQEYIRTMADKVKAKGKKVRMWGSTGQFFADQSNAAANNDIEIDFWSSAWDNAADRIAQGYRIVNVDSFHLYGNPGRDYRDIVNVEHIFNDWEPTLMSGGGKVDRSEPNLLGAKTALWADIADMGVTERDNFERILRQAAVLSEKTWGGTDEEQTFEEYSFKYERMQQGPGVATGADIKSKTGLVLDYDFANVKDGKVYDAAGNGYDGTLTNAAVSKEDGKTWLEFRGDGKIETELGSIDYPYTVQFDLKLAADGNRGVSIFDGRDGRLTVNEAGNLGLNRSYFTQDFGFEIPKGKAVKVTIAGTQQVTKLYIDGKLQKVLSRTSESETDYEHLLSTFVFPLTTIGEGLNGKIADLKVYNQALSPEKIKAAAEGIVIDEVNVSQGTAAAGTAQRKGDSPNKGDYDVAWKKLRVGWKAIDGDGNTLEGAHGTDVSEKDSYFEGAYADSALAVDLLKEQEVSRLVLQWDRAPQTFKIQTSEDGKTWTDVQTCTGETVNRITFEKPLRTRYIKMQGVSLNGSQTFRLRELEAYELVDKTALTKETAEAEKMIEKLGISFADAGEYGDLVNAYMEAESLAENALAEQEAVDRSVKALQEALAEVPQEPEKNPVTDIRITNRPADDQLKVGETWTLIAAVTPEDADDTGVTWTSSDSSVLAVDADGKLTAKKTGKAVITAIASDTTIKDTVEITVTAEEPEKPETDKKELEKVCQEIVARGYKESDYTAESWKSFAGALAKAEAVLADEKAVQEEVDKAKQALIDAEKALVKKEEPEKEDPDKNDPDNNQPDKKDPDKEQPDQTTPQGGGTTPQSGADAPVSTADPHSAAWSLSFAAAAGALAALLKKKRKDA